MRRAAARTVIPVVAAAALVVPSMAKASTAHDVALARKGLNRALQHHWLKPADVGPYRGTLNRAARDVRVLPKLRGQVVASQISQLTPLWDSYVRPRALSLFTQLRVNLDYLETHILPDTRVDVRDDDGVVYRWFPRLGLEFHPLASFGKLNDAASAQNGDAARLLADALVARAIPRGDRLLWEYQFRFGTGRPPWASGMAQAVAAQALARSASLLADSGLAAAAVRAYASVPPLLLSLPTGPWIQLYGFTHEVVLNAQLQAIVSLLEYSSSTEDPTASQLAARLSASAQALLPRFDTGEWSRYELGGAYATREYQVFVTKLLAKLALQTQDPFWIATSQRFHDYLYSPPQITQPAAPAAIWPQPLDGYLDVAQIPVSLSQRASVTVSVAGIAATYRVSAGARVLAWKPPAGLAPGTYPVQVSAVTYAGNKATAQLAPLVVQWDTQAPPVTASVSPGLLAWQSTDAGTPWLALAIDLVDPTGAAAPQTLDLGRHSVSGTAAVTIPPGTWDATLRATNSAGLTTPVPLGRLQG